MDQWADALSTPGPVSLTALVSLAVLSIYRGWWVTGAVYKDMREQRDYERLAKERALDAGDKLLAQNTLLIRGDSVADIALKSVRDAATLKTALREQHDTEAAERAAEGPS